MYIKSPFVKTILRMSITIKFNRISDPANKVKYSEYQVPLLLLFLSLRVRNLSP
jgi:hypothetical protein